MFFPVPFKPSITLIETGTSKQQDKNKAMWSLLSSEGINDMKCTKQPLYKQMTQHGRATSSGQDLAADLNLKESGQSFEGSHGHILARGDW